MASNDLDFDLADLGTDRSDDSEGIKSLRKALNALKTQLQERDAELNTFRTEKRGQTLTELLAAKGVPEAAFGLYPKDAEATEAAVGEWVSTYGAAFGITQAPTTQVPADAQEAMQQMQQASATAPAPSPGDMNTMLSRIQNAASPEELQNIYAEYGMRPA